MVTSRTIVMLCIDIPSLRRRVKQLGIDCASSRCAMRFSRPSSRRVETPLPQGTQGAKLQIYTPRGTRGKRLLTQIARADMEGVYDVVSASRTQIRKPALRPMPPPNDFISKLKAAWRIFFPPKPEQLSPKEAGKSRLRMILVADRCGMNQASMYEMRHSIVKAVSDFVEIEAEDLVEVNVSSDQEIGTVYSVAVPVRRVKPLARVPVGADEAIDSEGITLSWDADDKGSDPSDRFPYGC